MPSRVREAPDRRPLGRARADSPNDLRPLEARLFRRVGRIGSRRETDARGLERCSRERPTGRARASATRSGRACAGTSRCALRTEGSQAGTRSKKAHVSGFSPSLAARRDLDASAVSNYSRGEMIREAHWPWRTASSTRRQHHRARARARDAWPQLVPARVARAPSAALAASFPNRLVSRQCRNASARVTVEPASRRARRRGGPSPTEPRSSSRGRACPRHSRRRNARSARL